MTETRWAIVEGEDIEHDGRKFARGEDGSPMLCSMFCHSQGRVSERFSEVLA